MKIIILTPTKNNSGGVERFSYYLSDILKKENHEVVLLGREDLSTFEKGILRIKKIVGMEQPVLGYFLGRRAMKLGFSVCITNGMLGWNIKNKKIINVQHGTFARAADRIDYARSIFKYFVKKHIWGLFEGLAARHATVCIAVSQETKESVENYYGAKNVQVILNAVNTELFHLINCPKKDQVIFVGRFEYAKGKEILDGMKSYLESKNWKLVVAETLSQEELVLAYNESQIFLLPSLHEGCSYALLDAMACGLPFLASSVGLVPDLKQRGLFSECIVEKQTTGAYIEALENILTKTEIEKTDLRRQLREYILMHHNLHSFGTSYLNLIENL